MFAAARNRPGVIRSIWSRILAKRDDAVTLTSILGDGMLDLDARCE